MLADEIEPGHQKHQMWHIKHYNLLSYPKLLNVNIDQKAVPAFFIVFSKIRLQGRIAR